MNADERAKRQSIIDACLRMNALGINQGTSGNISLRHGAGMLITPTSTPYETMTPEQIVFMQADGTVDPSQKPSSEWRFHLDILNARPEVGAVVHAHPAYSTIIAIMGRDIPPIHYMIAAAGGDSIRCAPYATFGTSELSQHAVSALKESFDRFKVGILAAGRVDKTGRLADAVMNRSHRAQSERVLSASA